MVSTLLAELRSRDIRVWADGDRLRCNAPAGALTPDLHEQLRLHKDEILQFIRSAESIVRQERAIVPLQPNGQRTPMFGVGGHNGDVFCYRTLAAYLGNDQPFYGLQPPGLDGRSDPMTSIEHLATYFVQQIRSFQGDSPCVITGFCAGGMIAFEVARQLRELGVPVSNLVLFGAAHPTRYRRLPYMSAWLRQQVVRRVVKHTRALLTLSLSELRAYVDLRLKNWKARPVPGPEHPELIFRGKVERATLVAARGYTPRCYDGRVCIFLPVAEWAHTWSQPLLWRSEAPNAEVYAGRDGCTRDDMLLEPHARVFAEMYERCSSRRVETVRVPAATAGDRMAG